MKQLENRASGVLMPISSLPGKFGIGTFGRRAFEFADFLAECGQTYWQILPLGPTGYGDSPYQSFSTFAGNPYFIDLDFLRKDGFLKKSDYDKIFWGEDKAKIDYGALYVERNKVFAVLQENFEKNPPSDFGEFCRKNSHWLDDYALFMAAKDAHDGSPFTQWEKGLFRREKNSLKEWTKKCKNRISRYKILQYFFFKQWLSLKEYANSLGIKIIGDLPIYVAADSADSWTAPDEFDLDENLLPHEVAGCPPDAFSADGQLWGNPVYAWERQKKSRFSWWKRRLEAALKIYDVIRIDHFRAFDSYYCVPFGDATARNGVWREGPGISFFEAMKKCFDDLPVIAEDLGFLTDSVKKLVADSGFPGMKVLQFAFDSREPSPYLPHTYPKNCVVYTGTHDNDTLEGWISSVQKSDLEFAKEYLQERNEKKLREKIMISAMQSVANTCILCFQDLLGLDGSARINTPSSVGQNWRWRADYKKIPQKAKDFLQKNAALYQRLRKNF